MNEGGYIVKIINKINKNQKNIKNLYLLEGATFNGKYEFPVVSSSIHIPSGLVSFSDIKNETDYSKYVHFYIDDYKYESFWNNPKQYLSLLKKFAGVVSPDFSIYRNMTRAMQIANKHRNHALANWLTTNGINVIGNVRWACDSSFDFVFEGFEQNSIIAIGTHGCLSSQHDKQLFCLGLDEMIKQLKPKIVMVYGSRKENYFSRLMFPNVVFVFYPPRYYSTLGVS